MAYRIGTSGQEFVAFTEFLNRKFASYSKIPVDGKYGLDEARVIAEATRRYQLPIEPTVLNINIGGVMTRVEGAIATDELLHRMAWVPPNPRHRYEIQGVGGDSRAFLSPPDAHSFNKATDQFAVEANRLTNIGQVKPPIIPIGYSMGGVSVQKYLTLLRPDQRQLIGAVVTFGDPSMPEHGSMLGDDPYGGISDLKQPQWVWDRYYSYSLDGDWYPRSRGLMPFLYQVLTRAELSMEFALWLFTAFPLLAMQQLLGLKPSDDPLAGVLGPLAGALTSGPLGAIGQLLGPAQILMVLPQLVQLLFDAVKFLQSGAHWNYGNPANAVFDGMTAVDHAVHTVMRVLPGGGTTLLFPGTGSNWDQLFQFDTAIRLYNLG